MIVDWPDFPMRGMIEGYYGTPLSNSERIDTFLRMRFLRQNLYLYAPKDDAYTRSSWAIPYPQGLANDIASAAARANELMIDLVWGISPGYAVGENVDPGQSIQYSSDTDFERLISKVESVRSLGVRKFALLLDDIQSQFVWPNDAHVFPSMAAAHAHLLNRLQAYLSSSDPSARLLAVGTAYAEDVSNWQSYNQDLGTLLGSNIDIMWTGSSTFSRSISSGDLSVIDRLLNRNIVIWDNWPVSISALDGRSTDLAGAASGFLSNMILSQDDAHPIGDTWSIMGPLADYQWNPYAYIADVSLAEWAPLSGQF
jgi:hyaluronoglucosaminidase